MGKLSAIFVLLLAVSVFGGSFKSAVNIVKNDENGDADWWENGVFYQIYPRSFMDSDNNGEGDLKGITSKLQHLKDLGVTGTWLSPIFDSPMIDGGYDISDYRKVNPKYGSNEDLKALFDKAKELGLKIILDFVPNHSSNEHDWFHKSANRITGYENYYTWKPCPLVNGKRVLPNNWIAVFNGPMWTYDPRRNECYLHQFTKEQPDLNFREESGKVKQEMLDILTYWMEQGADGFRVDAINHMFEDKDFKDSELIVKDGDPNLYSSYDTLKTKDLDESYQFIYEARSHLDKYSKDHGGVTRVLMTEAYATIEQQTRWYGVGDSRGAHIPFNFGFIADITKDSKAADYKKTVDDWMTNMPSFALGQANWVLGNHDRPRIKTRFGDKLGESLAVMSMMLPGVAVVYYGEEIGMTDNTKITWDETEDPQACNSNRSVYQQFSRDPVRTPMQWDDSAFGGFCQSCQKTWLPVHENYRDVNVKKQVDAQNSTLQLYKNLIAMKKANAVLKMGELSTKVIGNGEVFAFERSLKNHTSIAVLINIGAKKTVNLRDLFKEGDLAADQKATVLIANTASEWKKGTVITNINAITLDEHDGVVFEMSSAMRLAKGALYAIAAFWFVLKFIL